MARKTQSEPLLNALLKSFSFEEAWKEFDALTDLNASEPSYNYARNGNVTSAEWNLTYSVGDFYQTSKIIKASNEDLAKQRFDAFYVAEKHKSSQFFCDRVITPYLQGQIVEFSSILKATLEIDDTLDWGSLLIGAEFDEPAPKKPKEILLMSKPERARFHKAPNFLQIILGKKQKILDQCQADYIQAVETWEQDCVERQQKGKEREGLYQASLTDWNERKGAYEALRDSREKEVEELKTRYFAQEQDAVEAYCIKVLGNSAYPIGINLSFDLMYRTDENRLVIDLSLPKISQMPEFESAKYTKSTSIASCKPLSEKMRAEIHEHCLYQICLRTLHEIFEADAANCIDQVVLNGFLEETDSATGQARNTCVLTVQSEKSLFESFDLSLVEPKECFKRLKGISGLSLKKTKPVAPVASIIREDSRFVDNVSVVDFVDEETNLAAMDWEDFEPLVRELFEKEFATEGSEVRVTQASADGGVDAVVFDPDPIRGGKIVIQAKRYTNLVSVSAVRDLYGTVMNEGAMKGILVTTSDFGPDSFTFVQDKPLTLVNGSNLLYLLSKHGYKASIDIELARNNKSV